MRPAPREWWHSPDGRDNMLGWDITDYGLGRFDEVGFSLITLRNGNLKLHCPAPPQSHGRAGAG